MPYPHKFIELTFAERVRIRLEMERLHAQGKERECKRLEAVYLSAKKLTLQQIARQVKATYRSVKKWVSTYQKGGTSALVKGEK
jgi:hypothetical protein